MEPQKKRRAGVRETVRAVGRALAPFGKKRLVGVVAVVALTAVVGAMAFTGFAFWWTSRPSFCGRCHPMKPFVAAWAESAHKKVNCESCHTTPGLFGFVGGKIAGLQVVANYIRGDYHDYSFNAAVSNGACLQCHDKVLEKNIHTTGPVDAVVSHKNIVEAGGKCISCHSTVAHGEAVPPGSQTHPTMAQCLKCHNDKIAPLRCNLCHTGRSPTGARPEARATGTPTK